MEINKSDIVISIAGRDKNEIYIVIDINENFFYLINGKNKRIENPKMKKNKHIKFFKTGDIRITEKIISKDKITNSEIRRVLISTKKSVPLEVNDFGKR